MSSSKINYDFAFGHVTMIMQIRKTNCIPTQQTNLNIPFHHHHHHHRHQTLLFCFENLKKKHGRTDSYRVATVTTVPDDNITADGFYKVFSSFIIIFFVFSSYFLFFSNFLHTHTNG